MTENSGSEDACRGEKFSPNAMVGSFSWEGALETSRLSDILSRGRVEAGFRAADAHEALERLLRPALEAEGLTGTLADAACETAKRRG